METEPLCSQKKVLGMDAQVKMQKPGKIHTKYSSTRSYYQTKNSREIKAVEWPAILVRGERLGVHKL